MAKTVKTLRAKPAYLGEREDRTSKDKRRHMCNRCDRLATHRARKHVVNKNDVSVLDFFFCEFHQADEVRKCAALPEYRKYLTRMDRWKAQKDAGVQETML